MSGAAGPNGVEEAPPDDERGRGGHSHWLMIACCVPMLAIAVVLVAGGASVGTLFVAVGCLAMMTMMMLGMSRS